MNDDGYKVISVEDDAKLLQEALDRVSDDQGVVVSVLWQPARQTTVSGETREIGSGYTVVADFGIDEPEARH